ncbi:PQQ-binding-like beta-propeller repeat protein [Anaerolinea thermophila]|uniref:beta-alanine-activating enzyme beta-propeller domain-containing protein n=1 Tax=Anaerolinea thermophila TaxID=167964 RepID=UPI0002F39AD1
MEAHRITQSFSPGQGGQETQLQPGSMLANRYLIQEVIGIGGMGSVYRARDLHFPNVVKLVAVKEMINQARDSQIRQTIVQNFEREANILATLNHPSIPRIFDYFTHDERSYLVLEYINGKDLEEILSESPGPLPEDRVVAWAIELCDVLAYLHNHKPEPIIFRDMKPSNVMVNQDGHIVLIDFGIAKMFRAGQKGTMIGTEGYSPPEQYRGEATPLADIYALGATLHHLLTKRDPRIETPFTFNERPVRKFNPSVSPELEAIINTAVQYNPQDRFQSAEEMKEALLNAARKTGVLSRIATKSLLISSEENTKPLWTFECEDEIRGGPAFENGLIYVGSYDNNLYAVDATDGKFVWKFPTEGGIVTRPAFGEGLVIFGSEDHRIYALNSRSGKIAWTYPTEGPARGSPKIAEGHAFVGSDDGFLYAINLTSSRLVWKYDTGGPVRSTPFIANDLIFFGSETGDLFCMDFRGAVKWRFKAKRAIYSSPLVVKGSLFFTSLDSILYSVDARTGWAIWRFRMGKGSVSSPCNVENYIIVGSADGFIYCVDGGTSKEIWRFKTDHQVSGSPLVYRDSVYCGAADGNLYCLEYRTGRLRWKFSTGGAITSAPIVYNDILYVGSADHILYALIP